MIYSDRPESYHENAHPWYLHTRENTAAVAAGADAAQTMLVVPVDGDVTLVGYTPNADITGADTDTRKLELLRYRGGVTSPVSVAAIQFDDGVDAVGYAETRFTLAPPAGPPEPPEPALPLPQEVKAGDVLVFVSSKVGNGMADPSGLLHIVINHA